MNIFGFFLDFNLTACYNDTMLTTKEVAGRFGVSPITARQWITRGLLKGEKRGRDWFVKEKDAAAFVRPPEKGGRPIGSKADALTLAVGKTWEGGE